MRGLSIVFPFINLHLRSTSQRDGAVVAQWGQRYTALCIQIGRQLPPLTYTLALRGLRPAGKTPETFTQEDEEGILSGICQTMKSFYAVIHTVHATYKK